MISKNTKETSYKANKSVTGIFKCCSKQQEMSWRNNNKDTRAAIKAGYPWHFAQSGSVCMPSKHEILKERPLIRYQYIITFPPYQREVFSVSKRVYAE